MSASPKSPRSPRAASPSKIGASSGTTAAAAPSDDGALQSRNYTGLQIWLYCATLGAGVVIPLFAPQMIYADAATHIPSFNAFTLNQATQVNPANPEHSFAVSMSMTLLALANIVGLLKQCPGSMGIFMASIANLAFVAKGLLQIWIYEGQAWNFSLHWIFSASAFLGAVLSFYPRFFAKPQQRKKFTKYGLNHYMAHNAVLALVMFSMPDEFFKTVFPASKSFFSTSESVYIPDSTLPLLRQFACLIGAAALANSLSCCPGALGRSMATTALIAQMLYQHYVSKSESLLAAPILGLAVLAFIANLFGLYQQNLANTKSQTKRA
jgi:hypothetical protein